MPETQDHENDEPIDQHDSADPTVVPSSELSEPVVPEPPTVNEQDSALTHTADTERSDDTEPDDEAAQKEAAALLAAQHAAAQAIEEALAAERQHEVRGNEDLDVTVRVRHDDSPAVPEDHSTETKPEPPAAKPKPKAEETDEADNVDKADTQDDDSGTKNDSAESDDDTATHEKHTDSGSKTTKNNDQDDSPATETIEPVAPAPPRTPSAEVDSDTPGNSDENPEQPDSPDVDTGTAETDADAGGNADLDTEHSTDETTEAGGSGEGGGHDGNDHGGDHGEGTGDSDGESGDANRELLASEEAMSTLYEEACEWLEDNGLLRTYNNKAAATQLADGIHADLPISDSDPHIIATFPGDIVRAVTPEAARTLRIGETLYVARFIPHAVPVDPENQPGKFVYSPGEVWFTYDQLDGPYASQALIIRTDQDREAEHPKIESDRMIQPLKKLDDGKNEPDDIDERVKARIAARRAGKLYMTETERAALNTIVSHLEDMAKLLPEEDLIIPDDL